MGIVLAYPHTGRRLTVYVGLTQLNPMVFPFHYLPTVFRWGRENDALPRPPELKGTSNLVQCCGKCQILQSTCEIIIHHDITQCLKAKEHILLTVRTGSVVKDSSFIASELAQAELTDRLHLKEIHRVWL